MERAALLGVLAELPIEIVELDLLGGGAAGGRQAQGGAEGQARLQRRRHEIRRLAVVPFTVLRVGGDEASKRAAFARHDGVESQAAEGAGLLLLTGVRGGRGVVGAAEGL